MLLDRRQGSPDHVQGHPATSISEHLSIPELHVKYTLWVHPVQGHLIELCTRLAGYVCTRLTVSPCR